MCWEIHCLLPYLQSVIDRLTSDFSAGEFISYLWPEKKRRTCRWWIIPFLVLKISIRLSHKYFLVLECVGLIVLFFLFNLRRERGGRGMIKDSKSSLFSVLMIFFLLAVLKKQLTLIWAIKPGYVYQLLI